MWDSVIGDLNEGSISAQYIWLLHTPVIFCHFYTNDKENRNFFIYIEWYACL